MEQPHFRTVLRGFDPDQVAAAVHEMQTSLSDARRTAADRTVELARVQQEQQQLHAALAEAQSRLAQAGPPGGPADGAPGHTFDGLGERIASMLGLAEEEANQMRATAEADAARLRDDAQAEAERMRSAAKTTSDEIVAQATEDARARRAEAEALYDKRQALLASAEADLVETLAARRQQADQEFAVQMAGLHERVETARTHAQELEGQNAASVREAEEAAATTTAGAREEADRIVAVARQQAAAMHTEAERELTETLARRDRVHAHLAEVSQLVATLESSLDDAEAGPTPAGAAISA